MSDLLQVELVSADRLVWSGEATMVIARTTEGDVGILPQHAPLLSLLVDGVVDVQTDDGQTWVAAVSAGFLSVAANRVSILAEYAEMSHDIDLEKARQVVGSTVDHLQGQLGAEEWAAGMHPEVPKTKILDNPYQYTDFRSAETHGG